MHFDSVEVEEETAATSLRRSGPFSHPKNSPFSHPTFQSGIRAFHRPRFTEPSVSRLVWVTGSIPKILIIDETSGGAIEIQAALKSSFDATFFHADFTHPDAALADQKPDVVLVRLSNQRNQAYEFCKRVRTASQVPLVVYGSREDEFDELMSLEIGADEFIPASRSPRILGARINSLLRRARRDLSSSKSDGGPESVFDDLEIDRFGATATFRGKMIDLPAAECRLLAVLAERPQQVVTTEEIAELLRSWGAKADGKAVRSRMYRLNAVIRPASGWLLEIKNRRLAGYALCCK